jgi:GH15 family glucan-1,4-alpha-glucosidase
LREATFTLLGLMHLGYFDEARAWRDWLLRTVTGSPQQVQIVYGVGGERWLPEMTVPWLAGYERSQPVRIANPAYQQFRLDEKAYERDQQQTGMFHAAARKCRQVIHT